MTLRFTGYGSILMLLLLAGCGGSGGNDDTLTDPDDDPTDPAPPADPPPTNQAPTVSFTQPQAAAVYTEGDTVHVVVSASDSDGSVASVELLMDGTPVRTENQAPYEWAAPGNANDAMLRDMPVGSYTLEAIATDDDGDTSTTNLSFSVEADATMGQDDNCVASGDLMQWHRVALTCTGFAASEQDDTTFTDHRLTVTFTQGNETIRVPGHFAADGNAADSGAADGDVWRAYFSPPTTGDWNFSVSFRTGNEIAVSNDVSAGQPVDVFDGETGTFRVGAAPPVSRDMRTRGLLEHRDGERYLRFAGDGSIYIEGGMDSPENIFGYDEFDNTTKFNDAGSCKGILHQFEPHRSDWQAGDPTWANNRGRSLIGLINYISSTGVNAIYIMMNTVRGDGCDAHPWTTYNASGDVRTFDVSKLDQWERALTHMTANGILIHVMTQETENDQLLNNGNLGVERQLYYRELISRFGHHPALQWNLGEENTNTPAQQRAFSDFIRALDPYDHPIFMHTFPNQQDRYNDLLGHATFDGPTVQFGGIPTNATGDAGVYGTAVNWLNASANAGKSWVVTFTEASGNQAPTPNTAVTDTQRVYWMWASVMSGGGGFEWYLKNNGAGHAYDLAVENLREFDAHWQQSGHLVRFFRDVLQGDLGLDLQSLQRNNGATNTNSDWVLANSDAFVVYLREGGTTDINLPDTRQWNVQWFNPRSGAVVDGNTLQGAGMTNLGNPPSETNSDWAVVITAEGDPTGNTTYQQVDGLVIMEAENTASALDEWIQRTDVSGFTGPGYIEFTGNSPINGPPTSPLTFMFQVNQSGLHYLHLHVARETLTINGEVRTDVANDAYIRLDGNYGAGPNVGNNHGDDAPLSALQSDTKFFGGNDNAFVWATGNRLDLGGETNKRVAVYDLQAGETYTFTVSGRSQLFKINRIVFRHESVTQGMAQDLSRGETR
ncbi:MAG: DUF5060 domain-containing protein [Pseudomonadota bacterium]